VVKVESALDEQGDTPASISEGEPVARGARLFFLDNLRAFVVVLVVVLHGSITYMVDAPEWWYVVDSRSSLLFTAVVLLVDVPIMLIMFFIAGYFAIPSLAKRGAEAYLHSKFVRLGAPWVVGVLFLAPLIAYMSYYSRGVPMSYPQFWASDFWTVAFQQSVYWFLGVLLLLHLTLVMAYEGGDRLRGAKQRLSTPTWKLFVLFWALMSLGMLVMNQFFPVDAWYNRFYLLVFQPLRVPLYIGYFWLGVLASLRGWFSPAGYQPRILPWGALWAVSGALYLHFRFFAMPATPEPTLAIQTAYAMLFNAFCLSSLMAGAALFQQKVNSSTPFWSSLSANSYGIYYIHPLILYPLAYLFLPLSWPLAIKATVLILLAILLSWAVSAMVLTRAPVVRRAFAGR